MVFYEIKQQVFLRCVSPPPPLMSKIFQINHKDCNGIYFLWSYCTCLLKMCTFYFCVKFIFE